MASLESWNIIVASGSFLVLKRTVAYCVRHLSQPHLFFQFMPCSRKVYHIKRSCQVWHMRVGKLKKIWNVHTFLRVFWCLTHYVCMIIVVNYSPCSQNMNYNDSVLLSTLFKMIDTLHNTYTFVHMNISRDFFMLEWVKHHWQNNVQNEFK